MTWRYRFNILFSAAAFILCLSAGAENSSTFNQKGMDELYAGHPDRAAEFFIKAIAIDPGKKHYYNNLASAYMRMGEYLKAEEHLKKSLQLDSNYARALSNMSVTLFYLGRYRESYNYYLLTKKADREYTEKRFEKNRVSSVIKKLSDEKPDDEDLKKIKEYMDSDTDSEGVK